MVSTWHRFRFFGADGENLRNGIAPATRPDALPSAGRAGLQGDWDTKKGGNETIPARIFICLKDQTIRMLSGDDVPDPDHPVLSAAGHRLPVQEWL